MLNYGVVGVPGGSVRAGSVRRRQRAIFRYSTRGVGELVHVSSAHTEGATAPNSSKSLKELNVRGLLVSMEIKTGKYRHHFLLVLMLHTESGLVTLITLYTSWSFWGYASTLRVVPHS